MKILYLSGARRYLGHKIDPFRDPSFIYRIHNPAISARELGHEVSIKHLLDLKNPFISKRWDFAIIHRPSFGKMFINALKFLNENNIPVFGDFDDLIFLDDYAGERPSVMNGFETVVESLKKIKSHLRAIELISGVIVSNNFLKIQMKKINTCPKKIIVMNNSWHISWEKNSKNFNKLSPYMGDNNEQQFITYFSGTRTHDRDLKIILKPLSKVLTRHKNIKFKIIGKVGNKSDIVDTTNFEKKIHFKNYHEVVSKSLVNLAPLENTSFNQAKSAIKVIEASFFGVKTICSPINEYLVSPFALRSIAYSNLDWEMQINDAIKTAYDEKTKRIIMYESKKNFNPLKTTKKFINEIQSLQ